MSAQVNTREPVAMIVSAHGDPEAFGEREIEIKADLKRFRYNTPLYAHPPGSGDLLQAAVQARNALLGRKPFGVPGGEEACEALTAAIARATGETP